MSSEQKKWISEAGVPNREATDIEMAFYTNHNPFLKMAHFLQWTVYNDWLFRVWVFTDNCRIAGRM